MREKTLGSLSRRDFLKGTAAGAVGVAGLGLLAGCGKQSGQTDGKKGSNDGVVYSVVNTDLLIIGSGFGATMAAFAAIGKGKRVTIVEKAPFSHGGGFGMNWDVIGVWLPGKEEAVNTLYMMNDGVQNTELHYQGIMAYPTDSDMLTYLQRGLCMPDRNEDGSVRLKIELPFFAGAEAVMPRNMHDDLAASPLLTVIDHTMITDLFINDGRCLGATGIHLPTGEFRVFRANATICATGPTTWIYGWKTIAAYSLNTPDNTGDVDMAAYRHGAGIGESECAGIDFGTTYPDGLAHGWGTMINIDAVDIGGFADMDGNQIFTEASAAEKGYDLPRGVYDRPYFNKLIALEMIDGAADKDNNLLGQLKGVHLRKTCQLSLDVFKKFGLDPFDQLMPIHDEIYERGGTPVADVKCMSEDIAGLFLTRGAGAGTGIEGGSNTMLQNRFGYYALMNALDYAEKAEPVSDIDWSPVETEYQRLHEIRTREVSDGLRPHAVRHSIQRTVGTCYGILRQKAALEAAVTELDRIRKQDMPKMAVTNSTLTYNREWKEAIENFNLLDAAELAVKASLMREETRGNYYYADFPEKSDEWGCMLIARQKDGKIEWEKRVSPMHEFETERSV